jgi:cell wall-associated NlpC family hydrolase
MHPDIEVEQILDLIDIPQDPAYHTKVIRKDILFSQSKYEKEYFRVWNLDKIDIELKDAMWAYDAFKAGESYGENLQLLEQDFFDSILSNSNFKEYATINQRAVTLDLVDVRAFPTNKPLLNDPSRAGEGFPFDYLQNSTIAANKPLFISHYSKDKEWVFVESSFAFGWVKTNSIVVLDKHHADSWQKAEQIVITKEGVPIYDEKGNFLFHSRIGMMLALISEDNGSFTVLTIGKYQGNKAYFLQSKISKEISHKGILNFNKQNITNTLTELQKTNYGWGGVYAQRDCSSTLRDFYAPFGLWLPRNSYKQSNLQQPIPLEGLSEGEVIDTIKKNAIPFETLLYKQGHIVMYVGLLKDDIIIFQNVWGVKTKKENLEGRFVIGKPIFSTLEVGKNLKNFDKNSSFLKNIKSLTRVTPSEP